MTSDYVISTDPARLDRELIHRFLSEESYWARGRSHTVVDRSLDHSLCFGVYHHEGQVGFARPVTDRATFAWIADVFVLPAHRGQGLGKRLLQEVLAHPELQGLDRWLLATADAHVLYARLGFQALAGDGRFMSIEEEGARRACLGQVSA